MAVGVFVTLWGRTVHVVAMPELTEPEALRELWYFWVAASAFSLLGFGMVWRRED